MSTRGPGKAKCWFKFMKKCLKRDSNPQPSVRQACTLTIRLCKLGWGGLMRACGAVATCVGSVYGLLPSRFNCLCQEGIQLTHMNGVRASALVFFIQRMHIPTSPRGGGGVRMRLLRIKKQMHKPSRHSCVWVGSLPGRDNQNGWGAGRRPTEHR